MKDSELIREAAVIRDETDQYANTAERVGTALVHMAEHITEREQTGRKPSLTLSQLDNPLGFATVMEWVQGLRGEQSYTFKLVSDTGRCIGHVWLHNDWDYYADAAKTSRLIEVVMCCATINEETGALQLSPINGSPRIYYRSYILPPSGGNPDGGNPGGLKWSKWQEYREYVTEPLRTAVAALKDDVAAATTTANEASEGVSDMRSEMDAVAASIPTGVRNLGVLADEATILSRCAQYNVCSDPFIVLITALYPVGEQMQSLVVQQQVTKNSDGSGVCMQYVYKGKARYTRYLNFNAAGSVTGVQSLQPDGVRNLYYTEKGFIGQRDMWGTQVGSGFFLPNKNDLREGVATATTVPLVLTKAIKDTATCTLQPATTARAGVMTAEHVQKLNEAEVNSAKAEYRHYYVEDVFDNLGSAEDIFYDHQDAMMDTDIRYIHIKIREEVDQEQGETEIILHVHRTYAELPDSFFYGVYLEGRYRYYPVYGYSGYYKFRDGRDVQTVTDGFWDTGVSMYEVEFYVKNLMARVTALEKKIK